MGPREEALRKVEHARQPTKRTCGQTCVAMAAGVTFDEAAEAVGHRRSTTYRDLQRGLAKLKVWCTSREAYDPSKKLPEMAILRLRSYDNKRWGGHWVLLAGGYVYDPLGDGSSLYEYYVMHLSFRNCRVVSYLPVGPY